MEVSINLDLDRLEEFLEKRRPKSLEPMARFAVLIPLIKMGDQWEVIFEMRSKNLNSQPGEVSFPGGKLEANESYRDASIRESMEELNVQRENIRLIGELDYLISHAGLKIHCFLGEIIGTNVSKIRPNPDEVDHIFTVPLSYFLETEPMTYYLELTSKYNEEFPYNLIPGGKNYDFRQVKREIHFYQYGNNTIWGYTAAMIKHLVEILRDLL